MRDDNGQMDWKTLPPDEKKKALFDKQKKLLDTFLSTGAITPAQYNKSLTCLAEKMGFPDKGGNV